MDKPHCTIMSLQNSCWQWGKIHTAVVREFVIGTMTHFTKKKVKKKGYSNLQLDDHFTMKFCEVFRVLDPIIQDPYGNPKEQRGAWKDRKKFVKLVREFKEALAVDRFNARQKVFIAECEEGIQAFNEAWKAEKARKWGLKHADEIRVKARSTVTTFMGGDNVEKARHAAKQKEWLRKQQQLQLEWDQLANMRAERSAKGIMSGYQPKKKKRKRF